MSRRRYTLTFGIVAAAVVMSILLYTTLDNRRPVISTLTVEPQSVRPLRSCQIMCNASDPDGDVLSYSWWASGGLLTGEGSAVSWRAPDSEGTYTVAVTVTDSRGHTVTDYVGILVRANGPPAIISVVANTTWTTTLGTIGVTCNATDPDGDELSYRWTASAGDISGSGATINWTAPTQIGIHNVTVVIQDVHGGSAVGLLRVSVAAEQPPTIQALLVTAEHCYLKTYAQGYKVGKGKEYRIECSVANATGSLSYQWSCTGGEISGEGRLATWIAPSPPGSADATITVIVSDASGNMAIRDLILNVVECSRCTFGC